MADERFLLSVTRYKTINVDPAFYLQGTDANLQQRRESRRKDRACKNALGRFEKLRGEILSQAIAVEKELDRVIATYFIPRGTSEDDDGRGEEDLRRDLLIDALLGQPAVTFSAKVDLVRSILAQAEILHPTPKAFQTTLNPVMEIRNQVAHRRVGIDWQTQEVALWDSKKRKWGFPVFGIDGKKKNKEWHDRIPGELRNLYAKYCQRANTDIHDIWLEVLKLHERKCQMDTAP